MFSFNELKKCIEDNDVNGFDLCLKKLRGKDKQQVATACGKKSGRTLIHWAAFYNRAKFVEKLSQYYPEIPEDAQRKTPLHLAVEKGAKEVVAYFCEDRYWANMIDQQDADGNTAVVLATKNAHAEIIKILALFVSHRKEPVFEAPVGKEHGCGLKYLRTREESEEGMRDPYRKAHAEIAHSSKKRSGALKYAYNVADIHRELRDVVSRATKNQGNIAAVQLSFEIKIETQSEQIRTHIVFPLKLPGFECYEHSNVKLDEPLALALLERLYNRGDAILGHAKHGQHPKFDGSQTDGQFVRHSEQGLVLALYEDANITMIANRLIAEIRSKYPALDYGCTVKIYTMVLHVHSNKTSCGPCEHVLLGFQSRIPGVRQFVDLFEDVLRYKTASCERHEQNAPFKFALPKTREEVNGGGMRMLTLFSADSTDGTHRKMPDTSKQTKRTDIQPTLIETSTGANSQRIWLSFFGRALHSEEVERSQTSVGTHTIFLSGSDVTPQTKRTKEHVTLERNRELDGTAIGVVFK